MFKSCLICTDFTDGLHRLINFVPSLAQGGLEKIIFAHSVPLWEEGKVPRVDEEGIEAAREKLAAATEQVPEGVQVEIAVPSGKPAETIPHLIEQHQAEVLFTGTPTRNLMQETLFGSTTVGLTKSTTIPLMILRPQLISTYTREELELRCQHLWNYLLIPYNDGEAARYLVEQIKEAAQNKHENFPKRCMLVWVITSGGRREIPLEYKRQEAGERLATVKQELEDCGLQVNVDIRTGNPLHEILAAALTFDISAIATAAVNRSALVSFTSPSFANEVLRHSWFPVLFFSPKR
ncbi:universal stress protein [Spirulina sp. CS-785/01]|uniref:universal stress protein n=1 Tax=Spirulina sp. CS-785/01 TaxID=3021716 RepID=UPI00232DBB58|nr:universal stress protein [Spirulina sp. CS-785/01]MDB9313539.1 universal stress protein [Spirulina sp. CS-785/01]